MHFLSLLTAIVGGALFVAPFYAQKIDLTQFESRNLCGSPDSWDTVACEVQATFDVLDTLVDQPRRSYNIRSLPAYRDSSRAEIQLHDGPDFVVTADEGQDNAIIILAETLSVLPFIVTSSLPEHINIHLSVNLSSQMSYHFYQKNYEHFIYIDVDRYITDKYISLTLEEDLLHIFAHTIDIGIVDITNHSSYSTYRDRDNEPVSTLARQNDREAFAECFLAFLAYHRQIDISAIGTRPSRSNVSAATQVRERIYASLSYFSMNLLYSSIRPIPRLFDRFVRNSTISTYGQRPETSTPSLSHSPFSGTDQSLGIYQLDTTLSKNLLLTPPGKDFSCSLP